MPKVNFKCDSYLNINELDHADPPLLRDIDASLDDIDFLASKNILAHDIGAFLKNMPLHARAMKETTSAAKQLSNERDSTQHSCVAKCSARFSIIFFYVH